MQYFLRNLPVKEFTNFVKFRLRGCFYESQCCNIQRPIHTVTTNSNVRNKNILAYTTRETQRQVNNNDVSLCAATERESSENKDLRL